MSFNRLDPSDFIVSADAISATLWSTQSPTLITLYTSSAQIAGASGQYYYNVYQTDSTLPEAEIQFAVAYGNENGSGSLAYNPAVPEYSPSSTIYGQWQDLVIGDENTGFTFNPPTQSKAFLAITFERARYKESLLPGSLLLKIGDDNFTDNSSIASSVQFTEAGRVFNVVLTQSLGGKSYGWLLPDIGTILLDCNDGDKGGIIDYLGANWGGNSSSLDPPTKPPMQSLIEAIKLFKINSQETITSDYIFIRARSSEFNYSENPSFISGSTGEVLYNQFINNPQTYITTVGLYNDVNELLSVAKLSRPLPKDFTSEALVRVKLDF
jgi:hypothetical protein